jgi:transposase
MTRADRLSPEVRERAVRMVCEQTDRHASPWGAITSIADKIGCTAETLRSGVRPAERDAGHRAGLTTDERARLRPLERETVERRRANEIRRRAAADFAKAERASIRRLALTVVPRLPWWFYEEGPTKAHGSPGNQPNLI